MADMFPGLKKEDMPGNDNEAWVVEKVHMRAHNSTHMDASWFIYC